MRPIFCLLGKATACSRWDLCCVGRAGEPLPLIHMHPHTVGHNPCLGRVCSVGVYVDLCVPVSVFG